ncbi:unnamed protein product [Microthlaspi erraticum]|uniref:DUF4283 domain-containing protein n=1 Tax=Microthlaspi erraticum TaxID=1685480 RepID=A0A6D2IUU9_9BRAS|nr:unnamed protein product [Microthlaspi erraticum]
MALLLFTCLFAPPLPFPPPDPDPEPPPFALSLLDLLTKAPPLESHDPDAPALSSSHSAISGRLSSPLSLTPPPSPRSTLAMTVTVSGYPLSKSPEPLHLCFEIPLLPAQLPFAQSSCRLVVTHVDSSFQIYMLLRLKHCLSYLISGSPPSGMVHVTFWNETRLCLRIRLWIDSPPLPQYEDIKLSLSLRLPQYEVAPALSSSHSAISGRR